MKILFLSDNFPPEVNAPATRLYEHARHWVAAGHQVTVITCAPNFPEGRVYPGYRNVFRSVEQVDGIRVVRVKTFISANEGFLKRTLDYMSFMFMSVLIGCFERRPDVVIATSPQFFAACGGWLLSLLKWRPFVFELRDLWPASITAVGALQPSLTIRLLEKLELFLYRRAAAIISVTHSFKNDLISRGIDGEKIHVVINGVDLSRYSPRPRDLELEERWSLKGKFVAGYIGTHGMAHALDGVVEAASMLVDDDSIRFMFVGGGADRARVEAMVAERGLTNIVLVSRQPKELMPRIWSLCDVAIVPLKDNPVFATVIPSKIFECMGMGIPVLMSLPEGEATGIVKESGCGTCVAPEDPGAMAAEIRRLAHSSELCANLSAQSRDSAQRYSREVLAKQMLQIVSSVAGTR